MKIAERRIGTPDRRELRAANIKITDNKFLCNGVEICFLPQMGFWKNMSLSKRIKWFIGI